MILLIILLGDDKKESDDLTVNIKDMKRKLNITIMLLVLTSILALQSCKKTSTIEPVTFVAAMPATPAPVNSAIIAFTGTSQTVNLSWAGTSSSASTWTVYFGKTSSPAQVATNVSTNTYTANVGPNGGLFYWQVVATDANNITTSSAVWSFDVNSNPGATNLVLPATNAIGVGVTPTLKWNKPVDPQGDALTYDVYLSTATTPITIVKSASTDTTFTVSPALSATTDYYWKVVTKDPYGGQSVSPIWKFTTGAVPADPINVFVGNYNVDEPAEAYSYGVSFTKVNTTTIKTTNYWNSGWTGNFTIDLVNLTYTLPLTTFQTGWTGTESGIINKTTGKMTGTYTIWQNGVINEQGVHTYTHL